MLAWLAGSLLWKSVTGGNVLARFGGALVHDFEAFVAWLSRDGWRIATVAACICLAVQHFSLISARHEAAKWNRHLSQCTAARHADRLAYNAAQVEAQAKNHADVARDESRKQELSNETVSRLNADLAELRRRLSQSGTAAPQSHPVKPGVPQSDQPASGTPGQAGVCLSPDQLLRAAENEERHDRLIDYVEGLSKIDPNER